jgi:hypothetical protein
MANLQTVKIFPSIGIARIGNSPDWYLGPEIPFPSPPPVPADGNYKDAQCRIRRQAQRFRLFGYYDNNTVKELTAADGTIAWTVHLCNAKAHPAEGASIDPGARTVSGANDFATFANGTYQGVEVPLGEVHTDDEGRLIVVGGYGFSSSPTGQPITTYLDNAGWHDDVADGPVDATITINGAPFTAQNGAWVICPPPRFAPPVHTVSSLFDTLRQAAIDQGLLPKPTDANYPPISFVNDIWPILRRGIGAMRVAAAAFGAGDHDTLGRVIPPPGLAADRQTVFNKLRPAGDMPLLNGDSALKDFQHHNVGQWAAGDFVNDWTNPTPPPPAFSPDGMTQAALENCVGAAFFPGIEATATVSTTFKYAEPYRFDRTGMSPGAVTTGMARPWQADFTACSGGTAPDEGAWWPAARPDSVYPQATPTVPADWTRGLINNYNDMVAYWYKLGFVVDVGGGQILETERHVVCRDCFVVTDRSEFSSDEVAALIVQQGAPATIQAAFYVIVEGFTPSELSITTSTPSDAQLQALAPSIAFDPVVTDLKARCTGMLLEDPSLPNTPQRFTFVYEVLFASVSGFTAELQTITLTATVPNQNVSGSGTIELIEQPNPYMIDGPVSWLSTDLRVFQITAADVGTYLPGQSWTGPNDFISALIDRFRSPALPPPPNHPFDAISTDETGSRLELSEKVNGTPVYNFAVCRVRYRALSVPAPTVRVFFRLFQTAATGTNYDSSGSYRRGGLTGTVIPLLGVQGGELVTIPCFAAARVDSSVADLNSQSDDKNVYTIPPDAGGNEVQAYFGCWLDINQTTAQFPIQPSPINGPFSAGRTSIQDLIRGLHQCLVAEIAFDPDPIPNGISTAASDKLAQRNLAIVASDNPGSASSHRIPHTLQIRPTRETLQIGEKPDELMIDWGTTPVGSTATLYFPSLNVSDILAYAGRLYETSLLTRIDDHTLQTKTAGVTYMPIPPGISPGVAGLLTLDLPPIVRRGQVFKVVVRQMTTQQVTARPPVPVPERRVSAKHAPGPRANVSIVAAAQRRPPQDERRILGAFQITIPVSTKELLLVNEERWLSVLRSVLGKIPIENRWFLVFKRYVQQIAERVGGFGGDPTLINPSPSGDGHHKSHHHHHDHDGDHDKDDRDHDHDHHDHDREEHSGKIVGLVYDCFGDFDGFLLDTHGEQRAFASREVRIEELVRKAWAERILVTVFAERRHPRRVDSIVLRNGA